MEARSHYFVRVALIPFSVEIRKYQIRVDLVEMRNFVVFFVLMSVIERPISLWCT